MTVLANYFAAILTDGDFCNDWITHLPDFAQPFVLFLGWLIAALIGA